MLKSIAKPSDIDYVMIEDDSNESEEFISWILRFKIFLPCSRCSIIIKAPFIAIETYRKHKHSWARLINRGMERDYSWDNDSVNLEKLSNELSSTHLTPPQLIKMCKGIRLMKHISFHNGNGSSTTIQASLCYSFKLLGATNALC
ncbi:soluble starch synthase 1, chloroplastic/amyloplastic [Artemisia annua]|uniref:Soluble starch synthase 1, chloroplastic/amyloplastic n=1 Tax=Artemisia annua TaxID=35608 RepID=A0A2U1NKR1_ARTAN|nr:soluble starch synthase 1, chloroplastic/amyloplastic [Artemisia annua]